VAVNTFPNSSLFQRITFGATTTRYSYTNHPTDLNFNKVAPELTIEFKRKYARSPYKQTLRYRNINIFKDYLISEIELSRDNRVVAGKNKAIQRAAIIADGGISLGKSVANTAEAVTKDLAKGAPFSTPLVALDIAVGATSAASIIKGTSDALKAVGGGGSISAPAAQQAPSGVSAAPQTGFQASSENQIATSIASQQNQTPIIKTYVVGSEVKTQTDLDAKLIQQNSFG